VSVRENMTERSQNSDCYEQSMLMRGMLSDIYALTGSVYHMHVKIKSTRRNVETKTV